MTLPTCCQFHGLDEDGCNQGRACPAHKPATKPDEPAIGYEAARLIQDEGGITYAGPEPRRAGWINWKLLAVLAVLCAIGYAVAVWWN